MDYREKVDIWTATLRKERSDVQYYSFPIEKMDVPSQIVGPGGVFEATVALVSESFKLVNIINDLNRRIAILEQQLSKE